MKKLFLGFFLIFISSQAFSQKTPITEPTDGALKNSKENDNKNGRTEAASTESSTNTYSVKIKKKPFKLPAIMAPANTTIDANCADRLGKGESGYTACEAGKRTR